MRGVKRTYDLFVKESNEVHDNKYDYSNFIYKNCYTKGVIVCPHHGPFLQQPRKHLGEKRGCVICGGTVRKTREQFIAESKSVHGNRYDYSKFEYKNLETKGVIICRKHGEFLQSPSVHIYGKCDCPKCQESKGERSMITILEGLGISYEHQKTFSSCRFKRPLPFDFAVGNILIEYDGLHHFRMLPKRGRWKTFARIIRNDRIKNEWAAANGYCLVRIRYTMQRDEIVKLLKNIFDKN